MFIEKNYKAQRSQKTTGENDIMFLLDFKQKNGRFPLFSQVLLETRTDCNRKCTFCPQYHSERPLFEMSWNLYEKIINELKNIGFAGRVALFMTNEPLLESRILDMISYARAKSSRFFLDLTTNGNLLSIEVLDQLLSAGLDNVNINDYCADREHNPFMISNNLKQITEVYRYNPKVTYNPRSTKENLSNYAGVIDKNETISARGFCNYPFRKLAISSTGNIILCCNDYHYTTNFGSVSDRSLVDIWHSEEMNLYRINLLQNLRKGLCSSCDEVQSYEVY